MKKMMQDMMQNKSNIMIIVGASAMSMMAGLMIGCLKEKMKNMETCCIIDEM